MLISLFAKFNNKLYSINIDNVIDWAAKSNIIIQKHSFCNVVCRYLKVIKIQDYIADHSTLRISFGFDTTEEDIDTLVNFIQDNIIEIEPSKTYDIGSQLKFQIEQ